MPVKRSKRETAIRSHFNLPADVEVFYSAKGMPGPDGKPLSGWFCCQKGVTRFLGRSADSSVEGQIVNKTVMPKPSLV